MGAVYEAKDPALGRTLALKVIHPSLLEDEEFRQRFLREARTAGTLSHPHIMTLYDVGKDAASGSYFMAMEHLPGGDLRSRLKRDGKIPAAEAAAMACELLSALEAAHEQGVVHRDVKPENILFSMKGQLKLVDFGIARPQASHLTQTGQILGTPYYMAPEQVESKAVDVRADLFSAGVVLYEMLSGEKPFHGDSLPSIAHAICYNEPPPLRDVQAELASAVSRLLSKKPEDRFPSAAAAREALLPFAGLPPSRHPSLTSPSQIAHSNPPMENARPLRSRKAILILAASMVLFGALFIAAAVHLLRGSPPEKAAAPKDAQSEPGGSWPVFASKETFPVEFRHSLSGGKLVIRSEGKEILRKKFGGEKIAGLVPKKDAFTTRIALPAGTQEIEIEVLGEKGKSLASDTFGITVREGERRTLQVSLSSLRNLSWRWK